MKASQRTLKHYPSAETHQEYKQKRNAYYQSIQKSKSDMWNQYVEELDGPELHKLLKRLRIRKTQQTPTLQYGGSTATTFKEKAELFRTAMFPPPPAYEAPQATEAAHTIPWTTVTDLEIKDAIFTSAQDKAAGPDGLSFRCLRQAYTAIPSWFNNLYKAVLSNGYHPTCWREAKGAILAKPNKPDYQSPKAYRIIALLNCLGKIAEKLVAQRLSSLCESFQLLHQDQMGGRPHRSAPDSILALVHHIQLGKLNRQTTSALFMDVKGAFDNVSRDRLLQTMKEMGLPQQLISWTGHFMTCRQIGLVSRG